MEKDDGGSAFPESYVGADRPHEGIGAGMSLRDYFAAHEQTLPPLSWVQSRIGTHITSVHNLQGVECAECLSAWRYQCADGMIKERKK